MCNNSNYSPALARTRTLNKSRERILHRFNSRMCLTLALDEDARIFHENWHIWIKGDFLNKRDESRKSHVRKLQTDAKEMKRVDGTGFYGWQMANGARLSAYKFEWNENRFVSYVRIWERASVSEDVFEEYLRKLVNVTLRWISILKGSNPGSRG